MSDFVLEYGRELFPGSSFVFCGVNLFDESRIVGRPEITGFVEDYDLEGALRLGLGLFPGTRNSAVIADADAA